MPVLQDTKQIAIVAEEITKTDAKGEATIETFPVWLAGTLGIDMTWLDKNGVENAANGRRTWKQRADENGKLTIYAQKKSVLAARVPNSPMSESSFMVHENGPTRTRITIQE